MRATEVLAVFVNEQLQSNKWVVFCKSSIIMFLVQIVMIIWLWLLMRGTYFRCGGQICNNAR